MQKTKATILLAEDDSSLAFIVKDTLEEDGYKVLHFTDGQAAIKGFDKEKIDICLLDIMMPFKDGYAVAKKIRQQTDQIPLIFLSTKAQEDDRIRGYEMGADDYLTKPFSIQELLKKVEVFLRRNKKLNAETPIEFKINTLTFLYSELKILVGNEIFNLTQKESDLLKFLCEHPNKLLKREEVLLHVWGKDDFFLGRSMDVYITKLRKYIKTDPCVLIETIHGIGYRFSVPL